ncbi:MAG: hypothetical protein ACR2K2_04700 [Mycobacteriales bacterium]
MPGLRPPLPAWAPFGWFAVLAVVLSAVVVVLVRPPGPLDQPDPAYQRDGLLLDGPVVPQEVAGVEFGAQPVVLLFDRDLPDPEALAAWLAEVPEGAVVRLVVPTAVPRAPDPPGYAVIDSDRRVRYSTLDPAYLTNAFEIATIVGSVR